MEKNNFTIFRRTAFIFVSLKTKKTIMKKLLASVFIVAFFSQIILAQDNAIRPAAVGISFFFNDFTTPRRVRAGSL